MTSSSCGIFWSVCAILSFCMLQIAHTGVVNMVIQSGNEMNVRVEDIRIV